MTTSPLTTPHGQFADQLSSVPDSHNKARAEGLKGHSAVAELFQDKRTLLNLWPFNPPALRIRVICSLAGANH